MQLTIRGLKFRLDLVKTHGTQVMDSDKRATVIYTLKDTINMSQHKASTILFRLHNYI